MIPSDATRYRQVLAALLITGLLAATPDAAASDRLRATVRLLQAPQVAQSSNEDIGRLLISIPSEASVRSAYRQLADPSHSPEMLIDRFAAMAGEMSALSEFAEIGVRTEYDLPNQQHKSYQQLGYTAMIWPELRLKDDRIVWRFIHEGRIDQRQIFVDDLSDALDLTGWRSAIRNMQRTIAAES